MIGASHDYLAESLGLKKNTYFLLLYMEAESRIWCWFIRNELSMILHLVFSLAFNRSTVTWGKKFKNLMNHRPTKVHGVTKSRTRLSDFTFTVYFHALEKEMATHSSVLAWRIPGKGEPGGLPSMGLHRVGHDRSDLAAAAAGRLRHWYIGW